MESSLRAFRVTAAVFWLLAGLAILARLRNEFLVARDITARIPDPHRAAELALVFWSTGLLLGPALYLDPAWALAFIAVTCQLTGDIVLRLPARQDAGR